jgi:hypothetical protein
MTILSYTGTVNTNAYKTIAEVASVTFTEGKTYAMQIQNLANIKIADAEFTIKNEKFKYTATSDDIYIKTYGDVILTILENV